MEALSPFCRGQTPAVPSAARPVHWWAAVCFCCSAFCCRLLLCLERHKQCRSVWLYSSSRASLATLELLTYLLELPPPLTAALTIHTTMLMILSHFLLWHNSRSSANRSNYNRLQRLVACFGARAHFDCWASWAAGSSYSSCSEASTAGANLKTRPHTRRRSTCLQDGGAGRSRPANRSLLFSEHACLCAELQGAVAKVERGRQCRCF